MMASSRYANQSDAVNESWPGMQITDESPKAISSLRGVFFVTPANWVAATTAGPLGGLPRPGESRSRIGGTPPKEKSKIIVASVQLISLMSQVLAVVRRRAQGKSPGRFRDTQVRTAFDWVDPGALGRIAAADQRPAHCNGFNARSEQKHSAGDKKGEIASGTKL